MDDFEKAIQVCFSQDPTISPAVRQEATSYCESLKSRPDAWRSCWEKFLQSSSLEVKFWCLQVLPALLPVLPPDARADLRSRLLVWLRDAAPGRQEQVLIQNKLALVYVGLLKFDYPAQWPSAWTDIIGLLEKGPNLVELFLRILATFDQEVVSEESLRTQEDRQRSHMIKHAMREGDAGRLAECWFGILGSFRQSAPQLVTDCLKVIGWYVVWVEILIIANDKFLSAICGLIAEAGPPANEACQTLGAVVAKKMPAVKKVQMLDQLSILRRLGDCIHRGSSNTQLLEREAALFNGVGEVVLEAYVELRAGSGQENAMHAQAAWVFLRELMAFVFYFFSHKEHQIATAVEPFLTAFLAKVKSFVQSSGANANQGPCHNVGMEEIKPILQQTLQLIIQRLAYPDWFQHDNPCYEDDETHVAFIEFRRSLTKIFKRIFLVDEQMGFFFVQASIVQLTQNLASVRAMEAEAVLFLYKETGEIVKDVAQHLQANGALATAFIQILDCETLMKADHWIVQVGLLEVYVRYGKIFALRPELFQTYGPRVLEAILGKQGIRAQDQRVASRACYMLSRFIKNVKQQVLPLTSHVYDALKDLLVVPFIPSALMPKPLPDGSLPKVAIKGALKADDQASLYEALAGLISAMPEEQKRPALQKLLEVPAGNLNEILNAAPARLAADALGHANWAARSIEAVGTISKGFPSTQSAGSCAQDWEAALLLVGRVLEKFGGHQFAVDVGLWNSALFLCRRMVEVLGDHFLGPLDALLPFLYASSQANLLELTTFAHQFVAFYQKKMEGLLRKFMQVLFLRPCEVWKQLPEDSEQLKREKFELGSGVLQLLKEIAQRCPVALLEPMLQPGAPNNLGQELVSFLLVGLKDPAELKALNFAAATWAALLEVAVGPNGSREALATLPLTQLMQQLLWSVIRMDHSDFQAQKTLGEAASILRSLTSARLLSEPAHKQAMETLQQALIGALQGLRSDFAPRQLCEALSKDSSLKEVRAALQQCATDWRKDCSS